MSGVFLSGENACQKDYNFAGKINLPSPTPTEEEEETIIPDPTETPDESEIPLIPTPTVAPVIPTPTPTVEATIAKLSFRAQDLLKEISKAPQSTLAPSNWLGEIHESNSSTVDSDKDGYTDWLEEQAGSDPRDIKSTPTVERSSLSRRIKNLYRYGESCPEGTALFTENQADGLSWPPVDPSNVELNCLSNQYQERRELNMSKTDADLDGLPDDIEALIVKDSFNLDSDGDGILDGKEVRLGSDPIVPDRSVP